MKKTGLFSDGYIMPLIENGSRRRTPRAQQATRELELTAMDDGENLTRFSGARCFWTEAGRR